MDDVIANPPNAAEDDSLDDFFAKKDKSKKGKKKKTKYVTTEALAKTLEKLSTGTEEEELQQPKPPRKEKESGSGEKRTDAADGEEWHEFEDESQRDYSDLKIQNFQISDQKPEEEAPEPQYNDLGELILPKEEGPWNKQNADKPNNPAPPKKTEPAPETAPATKSVYRPPHARMSGSATPGGILPGQGRRRRQEAPVINSEIDFPTLASAVQDTEHHVGFETVKSGAKSISKSQQQQQQQSSAQGNALTLGNQFDALGD